MISSAILYKNLKKWVCNPKKREDWFNNLIFAGNKVIATDTCRLALIKNYPAVPHMETASGNRIENPRIPGDKDLDKYLEDILKKCQNVIPTECQYTTTIHSGWFQEMKGAFEFLKKASKKSGSEFSECCMLNFHDGKLYALGGGEYYGAKFLLADKLSEGSPWYCCFNAGYLVDMMDLLMATQTDKVDFSIMLERHPDTPSNEHNPESTKWTGIWKFETEDLIAICTSVRITKVYGTVFMDFCAEEGILPESGALIELERKD